MDYNEFEAVCIKEFGAKKEFKSSYYDKNPKPALYHKSCIGGVSGGSCWDTGDEPDRHHAYHTEPEEFYELDSLLEKFAPAISFLQYKKLKELVESSEESQGEYYGNSTDYRTEYVYLDKLYTFLSERGYV